MDNTTTIKKKLRFVTKCKSCKYKRVADTPATTSSHELLIKMGFVLKNGIYVYVEKFDCGNHKKP